MSRARASMAAKAPGRVSVYAYSLLRDVPQSYLRHHLKAEVLKPALNEHGLLNIALADRLLIPVTRPGSRLGKAVRKAILGESRGTPGPPVLPPGPPKRSRPPRRWQEKPLPDSLADLSEAEHAALTLLRRRGFEVVPLRNKRFKVAGAVLSSAEMVDKAEAIQAREARLRAARAAVAQPAAFTATRPADDRRLSRIADPASVALLDRVYRSLAELAAMVEGQGLDLNTLRETLGTTVPTGENVFHVLRALAGAEHRPAVDAGVPPPRPVPARGKRPGRKAVDQVKATEALQLVEAGLSPTVAARKVGLGRSTVYREARRAGVLQGRVGQRRAQEAAAWGA